ncbi:chordin-like [Anneissia japonica]|uniref:chordin-like n=1 Tax=Anneissia japonica TaxID=1529436 RepID=UPI00142586A1|nr:chordin-like [Anneissia japonica]
MPIYRCFTRWNILLVGLFLVMAVAGKNAGKGRHIPLKAEKNPPHSRGITGCSFGGKVYDIDTSWHPNLGEPFFEMICVNCRCIAVVVNGTLKGKVFCEDIKNKCPDTECENGEDPVQQPGDCCKSCPSDAQMRNQGEPVERDHQLDERSDEDVALTESNQGYNFVALLTGTSLAIRTNSVARATFMLLDDTLRFTITYERMQRPVLIRFTNALNDTVFEHDLHGSDLDNKVCGVWRRITGIYQTYLHTKSLFVTLVTKSNENGLVRGRILSHRALTDETFSALMSTKRTRKGIAVASPMGYGGIMMMNAAHDGRTINFAILMDGLLENSGHVKTTTLIIELRKRNDVIKDLKTTVGMDNVEIVGVWNGMSNQHQKWLARGNLNIRIRDENAEFPELSGQVTPRQSCDTFQSVLSGGEAIDRPKVTGASGSAVLHIDNEGNINYRVQVTGLQTDVIGLTLEGQVRRNRRKVIADLFGNYENGVSIGTYSKPNVKELQLLLQNNLFINVATEAYEKSELRGRITALPYRGHITRHSGLPIPLSGKNLDPPQVTGAAGQAWLSLDRECALHYEVTTIGLNTGSNGKNHAYAKLVMYDENEEPVYKLLSAFQNGVAVGTADDVSEDFLIKMNEGTAYLLITTKQHQNGEIRGQILLPNSCSGNPSNTIDLTEGVIGVSPETDPKSCQFEDKWRADGSFWSPDYDRTCSTCTCRKKTVICDRVVCPVLSCESPETRVDECCPVCPPPELDSSTQSPGIISDNTAENSCYFEGDKKHHSVGSSWHPYVPPFGYVLCAICTCESDLSVNCTRMKCPPLDCERPIRLDPEDCCQVCPPTTPEPKATTSALILADEVVRGCSFGEMLYRHGDEWNPLVYPIGVMPCVTCRCKNGQPQCRKIECDPLIGCKKKKKKGSGDCCGVCLDPVSTTTPSGGGSNSSRKSRSKNRRSSK